MENEEKNFSEELEMETVESLEAKKPTSLFMAIIGLIGMVLSKLISLFFLCFKLILSAPMFFIFFIQSFIGSVILWVIMRFLICFIPGGAIILFTKITGNEKLGNEWIGKLDPLVNSMTDFSADHGVFYSWEWKIIIGLTVVVALKTTYEAWQGDEIM